MGTGVVIPECSKYKYLGVWVGKGRSRYKEHMEALGAKARQLGGLSKAVAWGSHNKTKLAWVMWEQVVKPAVLYGSEVMVVNKSSEKALGVVQMDVGRCGLGLLKGSANLGVLGEMGWREVGDEIAYRKLSFFGHLCKLQGEWWSRQIWEEGAKGGPLGRSAWWCEIRRVAELYGVDLGRAEGSREEWKAYIREQIDEGFKQRWRMGMEGMSSLSLYRLSESRGLGEELDGSWWATLLCRARVGRMGLEGEAANRGRGNLCVCGEAETVQHVLAECMHYGVERDWLVGHLRQGWEEGEFRDWKTLDIAGATAVVLGRGQVGLSSKQMGKVKKFLGMVWRKREAWRAQDGLGE